MRRKRHDFPFLFFLFLTLLLLQQRTILHLITAPKLPLPDSPCVKRKKRTSRKNEREKWRDLLLEVVEVGFFFFSLFARHWKPTVTFCSPSFLRVLLPVLLPLSPSLHISLSLSLSSSRRPAVEQSRVATKQRSSKSRKTTLQSKRDNERRPRRLPQAPPRGGLQGALLQIRRGLPGEQEVVLC